MRKLSTLAAIVLMIGFLQSAFALPSGFETIKKRVVEAIMNQEVDDKRVEKLLATLGEDGTWPDINYADVSREGFQNRVHHENMVQMARAYKTPTSKFYQNKKLKGAIELALKHWVEKDYFCENWHPNQIGTPTNLVYLMLIMGDELPKELVDKAQPIIGRANLNASGARPSGDRIKIAGILAKNLLFLGDKKQFDEVIKVIEGEIKFSTGKRGIQHDYSFHHREDRVNNTLSYGTGYADAFAEWAAYVAGTEYAFSEEKIDQLIDYYLDGICKQMVYGKYEDTGTKNRDISRADDENAMGTSTPEKLDKASDYRKNELEEIIKIRNGEATFKSSFDKFFWQTEYYVHQRPDYFASVRMHSTRNHNMEVPYNSEGLKNHHRGDGTNYISVRGDEYLNTAPVYDWQKIPGATILQKPAMPSPDEIQKPGLTDFVGAVTDGMYGAVGYNFKSPHDQVSAKKAWFFFDSEYVCLGAGIKSGAELPVVTTLNQCLLKGDVLVGANNQQSTLKKGEIRLENVNWVFHDGIGYIFPKPARINVLNQTQTGSWWDINKQTDTPREPVNKGMFKLWFDHGNKPTDATYEYIVTPAVTLKEIQLKDNHKIDILVNTPFVQAVKHNKLNLVQAVFYNAAELQITPQLNIALKNPGIMMLNLKRNKIKSISVSDPTRKLKELVFTLSVPIKAEGKNHKIVWDAMSNRTEITVTLPKAEFAGSSVTIEFK